MPINPYAEELQLALKIASEAGDEIMRHFGAGLAVETKADSSPVTLADRRAEELIRAGFARYTPDYGIIGEEFGTQIGSATREWVIDPIDGTKSFIAEVPLFGTLIALLEDGHPIVGLIALPALQQTLYATLGGGAFVNGRPCRVSRVSRIEDSLLLDGCITTVESQGYGEAWGSLRRRARVHRGWGDCYGHYLVATGRAEVMVDTVVSVWDVAPLGVILPEAGGRFTALDGSETVTGNSGVSSNGLLHAEVLATLSAKNSASRAD